MPDWILHIGLTHALLRPWRLRGLDPRWLLLGAVLPDVVPRIFGMVLHFVPLLRPIGSLRVGLHVGFFHTPFCVLLLCAALVAIARRPRDAALGLGLGSLLHFLMDGCQKYWGSGSSMLFPFDLTPMSWHLTWYDHPWVRAGVWLAGAYCVGLLLFGRPWPSEPPFRFTRRRGLLGAVLLLAFLVVPQLGVDRALEMGLGNAWISTAPERLEGQPIDVSVTDIEEVGEGTVSIDRADTLIEVDWTGMPAVEVGDFVSIRGVYRDGRIEAHRVFVHDYRFKVLASLCGGVLLVLVWLPSLLAWCRAGLRRQSRRPRGP